MDHADNEHLQEEAAAEGGVPMAAIEIEIPEVTTDNPESPSPAPSSTPASPGPPFPVDPLGYNSEEEAFGGAEVQIFSSGGVGGVCSWCSRAGGFYVGRSAYFGTIRGLPASDVWAPVGGASVVSGWTNHF